MLTQKQILDMLEQQEALEIRISGEGWQDQKHNYALAVSMECAELLEWHGWKWWKQCDEPNWAAIGMELVDIWHFALASALSDTYYGSLAELSSDMHETIVEMCGLLDDVPTPDFIMLAQGLMTHEHFALGNFIGLCGLSGLSGDELYRLYCCKNVLNRFRQDRGYAEGLYAKLWGGVEDNDRLMEISLEAGSDVSSTQLYNLLDTAYREMLH